MPLRSSLRLPDVAATTDSIADVADGSVVSSLIASAKHGEPGNALSLPTWVIHASSLIEWLAAMSRPEPRGRKETPELQRVDVGYGYFHASGLAACTFHVFYNSRLSIRGRVTSRFNVSRNAAKGIAAYRVPRRQRLGISSDDADDADAVSVLAGTKALQNPSADILSKPMTRSSPQARSTLVSALVKWGSLRRLSVRTVRAPRVFYDCLPDDTQHERLEKLSDDPTKKADSLL